MTKKELKIKELLRREFWEEKEMVVYELHHDRLENAKKRDFAAITIFGLFEKLGLTKDSIETSTYLYNDDESFYKQYAKYRRTMEVFEII